MTDEFQEIGHSGGKITFGISTDAEGRRSFQVGIRSSRPVPMALIAVYALPQGVPVDSIQMGGMGQPWSPPPFPGCFPVLIASDSEGKFGHHCPNCDGYWRSGPWPGVCPYCAIRAQGYQFLSKAQQRYVRHYCKALSDALNSDDDGETVIDMDAVADAIGQEGDKPAFYVSEESQQRKFTCVACEEFNDILGRFGFCSACGTRNDLAELVPVTERRKRRLVAQSFHDLREISATFNDWFDIDLCADMKEAEFQFVSRMFFRRHVYEHNGGEVDQKYLGKSADTTVRLKQHIHETKEDAHSLLGSLVKMARNLHGGFHILISPVPEPIKAFEEKKERMAKWRGG